MINKEDLIHMGFESMVFDDYEFMRLKITDYDYLIGDINEMGVMQVQVGDMDIFISEASDLKQLIEIFNNSNKSNNDKI
jgi:hypothetical protein